MKISLQDQESSGRQSPVQQIDTAVQNKIHMAACLIYSNIQCIVYRRIIFSQSLLWSKANDIDIQLLKVQIKYINISEHIFVLREFLVHSKSVFWSL